ncbi:type II toxin-antitoxin system RelE/ParE family toxin [Paenalcaligenes niemegkensis]|uniref:type II toxin-antitoxin system RelE/ParE family toxin n=1 Tax=Paenalcaligenes niemegkensis TaxID=2895469 RepID=UPI001EE98EB5|nr:type II toxin-antitoxin system RelE/ParE family toxin [Paenalcaligenes niemegkensis]MCQ9616411.1 type II toxin-antitoxin system RelE/ParE family toxin [Paenalcaligenes niemegkensis]
MSYSVPFTEEAQSDLLRLYDYLLEQDPHTTRIAEQALNGTTRSLELLGQFPYSCRKATPGNPYLRELIIPFSSTGYVVLFEIEPDNFVTISAVRHQWKSDYH